MLYSSEISPTRCKNCVFYSQWLYSTCFGRQSHPSYTAYTAYTALYSWWWVRLSPETCRVKPLRIKNAIVASCIIAVRQLAPLLKPRIVAVCNYLSVDSCGLAVQGVRLRPLACWDCEFEFRRGHEYLSRVSVLCCLVEVSTSGWSLFHRSPTECSVSECNGEISTLRRPWSSGDCWVVGNNTLRRTWVSDKL